MLSAIPSLQHFQHALLYSNDDVDLALTPATDPSISPAQLKLLASDPNRVLCQFESHGGECRDPECRELHFKDLLPAGKSFSIPQSSLISMHA
jgi:hypothetical protein